MNYSKIGASATIIILIILSAFNVSSGTISWSNELSNFDFITAFVDVDNNVYVLGKNMNTTTDYAFKFAPDGSLSSKTELNEEVLKTDAMKIFTSLNNGSIVGYTVLGYYRVPYMRPLNLSYYDKDFNLDHKFIIDPGKIAEGYGILALRVMPEGDIYLMLSTDIRNNSTDNYVRFIHMAPNGSILWNTKFSLSLVSFQQLTSWNSFQEDQPIFASVSNAEPNGIYYSVGNALFKLDPNTGKLGWLHIIQSGAYTITATSIGVVVQTLEVQNGNPLYKLICISPDNKIVWSANAISKEIITLSLANFELDTKDDIIGCMFTIYGSSNNVVGVWLFYSLWDKNGRKIDEYTINTKSFSELSSVYLAKGSSYIVVTPDSTISGSRIYCYQNITKHAVSSFGALLVSLLVLSPLFKKLKKLKLT